MNLIASPWERTLLTRILESSIVIALSGLIAWSVSTWIEWSKYSLDVEKGKLEIIGLIKDKETTLAQALIDYYTDKYASGDESYKKLLTALSNFLDSSPGTQSKPEQISEFNSQDVRNQFNSANRRKYAESLVASYVAGKPEQRTEIIDALIDAILDRNIGELSRYRVNIYIALTFSLLPPGSVPDPDQQVKLRALTTSPDYGDPTFKLNVDNAIMKQQIPS